MEEYMSDAIDTLQGKIDEFKKNIQANDATMKFNDEKNIEIKKDNDKLIEALANLEASIAVLKEKEK
jgi:hypothetical protein